MRKTVTMRSWLRETGHHTLDSKLEYEQYSNNMIYVVVLMGYMPAGPTIFAKLHHAVAMVAT